jgi:hypothetical protein
MYLSENQGVIELVGDLSGRPPIVEFSIDSFLKESTFETTSSQLSLDSSVNSDLVNNFHVFRGSFAYLFQTRGTPAMKFGLINWASSRSRKVSPVV